MNKPSKAPRYIIVGWTTDSSDWSIYHWDYMYETEGAGIVTHLERLKKQSPHMEFSVLVNIHHFETHKGRDKLLEAINGLT